jgi:hypothetical protein
MSFNNLLAPTLVLRGSITGLWLNASQATAWDEGRFDYLVVEQGKTMIRVYSPNVGS